MRDSDCAVKANRGKRRMFILRNVPRTLRLPAVDRLCDSVSNFHDGVSPANHENVLSPWQLRYALCAMRFAIL